VGEAVSEPAHSDGDDDADETEDDGFSISGPSSRAVGVQPDGSNEAAAPVFIASGQYGCVYEPPFTADRHGWEPRLPSGGHGLVGKLLPRADADAEEAAMPLSHLRAIDPRQEHCLYPLETRPVTLRHLRNTPRKALRDCDVEEVADPLLDLVEEDKRRAGGHRRQETIQFGRHEEGDAEAWAKGEVGSGVVEQLLPKAQEALNDRFQRLHRAKALPMSGAALLHELEALLHGWRGLARLHEGGVLHVDLRSDNMVYHGGTYKFIDWGYSLAAGPASWETMLRRKTISWPAPPFAVAWAEHLVAFTRDKQAVEAAAKREKEKHGAPTPDTPPAAEAAQANATSAAGALLAVLAPNADPVQVGRRLAAEVPQRHLEKAGRTWAHTVGSMRKYRIVRQDYTFMEDAHPEDTAGLLQEWRNRYGSRGGRALAATTAWRHLTHLMLLDTDQFAMAIISLELLDNVWERLTDSQRQLLGPFKQQVLQLCSVVNRPSRTTRAVAAELAVALEMLRGALVV